MKLLCQGQSETWNVNRKAQLFPSKPGSCANKVFGTSRFAFNHISLPIETRCDTRHQSGNAAAISSQRQTAALLVQKSGQRRTTHGEQRAKAADHDSESHPKRQAQKTRTQRVQMRDTTKNPSSGGPAVVGSCTCGGASTRRNSSSSPVDR